MFMVIDASDAHVSWLGEDWLSCGKHNLEIHRCHWGHSVSSNCNAWIWSGTWVSCHLPSLHHTVTFHHKLSNKQNLSKNNLSEGLFPWMLGAFLGHEAPLGGHFENLLCFSDEFWTVTCRYSSRTKKKIATCLTWKETICIDKVPYKLFSKISIKKWNYLVYTKALIHSC